MLHLTRDLTPVFTFKGVISMWKWTDAAQKHHEQSQKGVAIPTLKKDKCRNFLLLPYDNKS